MLTKKIFLASSSELKEDRKDFEIYISRKNKDWVARGVFLELIVWEDFLDAVSKTRLQDEYNKAIQDCDLFVMLFCTKVGQYTEEEFEIAFGHFKDTNKPLIYTYFKDAPITTGSANREDLTSLWSFQDKLRTLGHYQTVYNNIDGLKFHFNQQIDSLAARGFIELETNKSEAFESGVNGSDLNVSPVSAPHRIIPLDGHPVLSPPGGPSPLYTGGFHISFTISHNDKGKHSIHVHAMELEVVRFTPEVGLEYAYRVEGAAVIGAGMSEPHVFSVTVFGDRVTPAQWVNDAKRGSFSESKSVNFFDTNDPPRYLKLAIGETEELKGMVLAQEQGLYELRFVFYYGVAGVDRHKTTEVIHVYADE